MDNHVHFIAVPESKESLSLTFGQTHKLYTRMVNFRKGWRGYLWQGRFHSHCLDEKHLYAAVRYVERNPVEAGLVERAEDYPYSSARSHIHRTEDPILSQCFLTQEIQDWRQYLMSESDPLILKSIQTKQSNGRPLGNADFIKELERITGKILAQQRPGPKPMLN